MVSCRFDCMFADDGGDISSIFLGPILAEERGALYGDAVKATGVDCFGVWAATLNGMVYDMMDGWLASCSAPSCSIPSISIPLSISGWSMFDVDVLYIHI